VRIAESRVVDHQLSRKLRLAAIPLHMRADALSGRDCYLPLCNCQDKIPTEFFWALVRRGKVKPLLFFSGAGNKGLYVLCSDRVVSEI